MSMSAEPLKCCDCGAPGMGRTGRCECGRESHSMCSRCGDRMYAADWKANSRRYFWESVEGVFLTYQREHARRACVPCQASPDPLCDHGREPDVVYQCGTPYQRAAYREGR